MNTILYGAIFGFISGVIGYIIAYIWIRPIRQYLVAKKGIIKGLERFEQLKDPAVATAQNSKPDSEKDPQEEKEIKEALRRLAMQLSNCAFGLPAWYKIKLKNRNERPDDASKNLFKLENMKQFEHIQNCLGTIKDQLNIK